MGFPLYATALGFVLSGTMIAKAQSLQAPQNVKASDGMFSDYVEVKWDSVPLANSYEVWRNSVSDRLTATKIGQWVSGTTTFQDVVWPPEQKYFYWVKAKNSRTESSFSEVDDGFRGLVPLGSQIWKVPLQSVAEVPAIGPGGVIYTLSILEGPREYALSAVSPGGEIQWQFRTGTASAGGTSPSIGTSGVIYFGANTNLYAVNPNGTLKWSYSPVRIGIPIVTCTPAVGRDGTIYSGTSEAFVALTPEGELKWMKGFGASSIAINDQGMIFVASTKQKVFCLSPEGAVLWEKPISAQNVAIGQDGTIFFKGSSAYAVAPDGRTLWEKPTGGTGPLLIDSEGRIYLSKVGGGFSILNPDGTLHADRPEAGELQALGIDCSVFVVKDGYLQVIDREGIVKVRASVSTGTPVVIGWDGTLYSPMMVAIRIGIAPERSSWPMWFGDAAHTSRVTASPFLWSEHHDFSTIQFNVTSEAGRLYYLESTLDFTSWRVVQQQWNYNGSVSFTNKLSQPFEAFRVFSP